MLERNDKIQGEVEKAEMVSFSPCGVLNRNDMLNDNIIKVQSPG